MKTDEALSIFLSSVIESPQFQESLNSVVEKALRMHAELFSPPSTLLTVKETTKKLRISLPTLHDYTKNGIIPHIKMGKRVLYNQADVYSALQKI